ncbi:MAG: endonuclease MutS2, partial [Clostridia bacterium]|nr:endonuclease MutS2 [Clostridia bacterium]
MNEKVLKTLEYDLITEKLKAYTACCIGRETVKTVRPVSSFDAVKRRLELTAEAESVMFKIGGSPVCDFPDIRQGLKRMHAALYLSIKELLDIARCLKATRSCKETITSNCESGQLKQMADSIMTHRSIEEEIQRCIISEDEISDGASPALMKIRREMRITSERVREKLNAMIRSTTYQKYLQEPLITIRNGRFVLPVKQEYRQNVPGLIHDQSGSGATLFIEPMSVVELGNEYKKLCAQEEEEIERILTELTALAAPYADDIYEDMELVGDIDTVFAKALLSREMNAVMPKINASGRVRIVKGRHPLIDANKVVPIDVWLGEDFSTLIITGPNTGGKTVTLKTVGLFTLMAQSGMFVPANVGTELAVFDEVFADIGDEQ